MRNTQIPTRDQHLSPLEQARRLDRGGQTAVCRELGPADQAKLEEILAGKLDYVHDDLFEQRHAERRIFDEALEITKPDTSWYHPLMDNIEPTDLSRSGSSGTVLLSAAQERALFLQFNYCRYRVVKLCQTAPRRAMPLKRAREVLEWNRRAEAYRDQIAQTNLALVLAMAKRTRLSEVDFGDLVSEGNMALLRAIDKFDVSRGFKFSTYACRAILKAFSRMGVKSSKYRQVFPTDFDPKYEKSDFMETKRRLHEEDCVDEIRRIMADNRAELTDIETSVIEHRFGLGEARREDRDASPLTLEQVGRIIGVTKERVRQIQNKALAKMRQTLEEDYLG